MTLAVLDGAHSAHSARSADAPTTTTADTSAPIAGDGAFVLDARKLDAAGHRAALRILQQLHDVLLDPEQSGGLAKWSKHIRELPVVASRFRTSA